MWVEMMIEMKERNRWDMSLLPVPWKPVPYTYPKTPTTDQVREIEMVWYGKLE
jgi:hypothetical protein